MPDEALAREVESLWDRFGRSLEELDRRRLAAAPAAQLKRPGVLVALALAGAAWLILLPWPRPALRSR